MIWRDDALSSAAEDERELRTARDTFRDEAQKWAAKAGEIEAQLNRVLEENRILREMRSECRAKHTEPQIILKGDRP